MSTNINLLKALSQILFSAAHKQFPVTSRGVSHAGWVPNTLGAQLLRAPGHDSSWGRHHSLASAPAPIRSIWENSVPSLLCFLSSSLSSPGHRWLLRAWQGHGGTEDTLGVLLGWGELRWARLKPKPPQMWARQEREHIASSRTQANGAFPRMPLPSSYPNLTLLTHLHSQLSSNLVHPSFLYVVCLGCNVT